MYRYTGEASKAAIVVGEKSYTILIIDYQLSKKKTVAWAVVRLAIVYSSGSNSNSGGDSNSPNFTNFELVRKRAFSGGDGAMVILVGMYH